MRNYLFAGAAAAALMVPASAYAQQITSGVEGSVVDEAGNAIPGAEVSITDTRTGATRTVTTGGSGSFSTSGLTVGGPYTVSTNVDGFGAQTIENINLTLQGATRVTLTLASGGEDIVVTASRANTTQLAIGPGTSFSAEVLENAPSFNRDVRDVIRLDPRVSLDRDDGGSGQDRISCLGGNDRGNTFTVDGIPQSDIYGLNDTGFSSRSSTPLPFDAIRETQVQFAPFDVDYGQFTGCAINVVTKSGTNEYRATGFFEYSDAGLRGDTVAGRPVAPIEPEKRWGVTLGGPIIKDRLFIFGGYEHQEAGQSQDDGPNGAGYANEQAGISLTQFNEIRGVLNDVYGIDTGDLVYNREYKNDRYFVRADLQINDRHRLEATYQRLEESTLRPDDLFVGNSPQAVGRNTFYLSGTKSDYYSGRLYSQWTDQFSTELRYARSEIQDRQDPVGGGEAQSGSPIPRIIVGVPNAGGINGTVLAGPGNSRSANDLRTTVEQYRAVGRLAVGDHTLKVGFELNKADLFNLFVQNATGTLVFRNIDDLRAGLLSPGTGNNQLSTIPNNVVGGLTEGAFGAFSSTGDINDAAAQFDRSIYSIYAQDEWRMTDRLKVTAGVRADWYDGGAPAYNPIFAQRFGFPNSNGFSKLDPVILPRLGFAYDFDNDGLFSRSQLRGGVGIFSGGDPLVWFGNAFQNDGRGFSVGNTQSADCATQVGPNGQISVISGGQFTGVPTCIQNSAINTAAVGNGATQSIDPDLKISTVVRANLGFQTDLNFTQSGFFSGWHVNLDYIYSEFRNPFTLVDLAQTIDIRKGLNGYTADGRPIYSTIDPLLAGCDATLTNIGAPPVYTNVSPACFTTASNRVDELMFTNQDDGYRSHVASFLLSKNFEGGLVTSGGSSWVSFGYAYTNSHDRRNMYNSTAGSNYDQTAAFDRQNPDASPGFFQSKHNFTFATNFSNEFVSDLETSLGFTFVARSGRPYSLTFTGNGAFNAPQSGNDNALVYIPTGIDDPNISPLSTPGAVQSLIDFASNLDCAKDFSGRTVTRNSCDNDWYFDLDLSFSQELPGPGRLFGRDDRIKVYAMFDNFLNFLDDNWNVQRRRNFYGVQDIASLGTTTVNGVTSNVDAQGRYIISGFNGDSFDADNQINISSSVWRLKFGVSYAF